MNVTANPTRRSGIGLYAIRVGLLITFTFLFAVGCGGNKSTGVQLSITSIPEGATVSVDGEPYGPSPVVVPNVQPGPVLVELALEGFKDEWETVRVEETPALQEVEIAMRPLEGLITVESTPSFAEVRLSDGTVLGDTPLVRAAIPAGWHTLIVEKENYVPKEYSIEIQPDFVYKEAFLLEPKNATLRVLSIPTGANLWLNTRRQNATTPVVLDLSPGTYTVGVHAPGYVAKEQVVELSANADETIELQMEEGAVPEGMVLVPAGEFTMGFDKESPDERPARTIHLDAYYIDKYEVTNEEYQKVVPTHTFKKGEENYPVVGVTWQQATAYARAIGRRLPTEAEWEKAARGTDARAWPWGNSFDASYCASGEDQNPRLREIGSFPEGISPYGCLDMAGNAREWTQSWYEAYPGNEDVDTKYGQVYRVLRGGSYLTGAFDVRTVRRHYERMDVAKPDFGFRCAQDVAR